MKKIFFLFFLVLILTSCFKIDDKSISDKDKKLKICPDAWYENHMPSVDGVGKGERGSYLIVNRSRKETNDFDINWIKENCKVNKPEKIY